MQGYMEWYQMPGHPYHEGEGPEFGSFVHNGKTYHNCGPDVIPDRWYYTRYEDRDDILEEGERYDCFWVECNGPFIMDDPNPDCDTCLECLKPILKGQAAYWCDLITVDGAAHAYCVEHRGGDYGPVPAEVRQFIGQWRQVSEGWC
jgi:hypothetical protein